MNNYFNFLKKAIKTLIFFLIISTGSLYSQKYTLYPDIPRIDVHSHPADEIQTYKNYLKVGKLLKERHGMQLAIWINLGYEGRTINLSEATKVSNGRILCCISDFSPHNGLKYPPNELQSWLDKGFIGYKIWAGPYYRSLKEGEDGYRYIDNPAHEPTFSKMEEIGMVAASIHIADPNGPWGNRENWLTDPVDFWRNITAWRHVLEKHPKLIAVVAHSNWLICQDAQLDYLRNMLATFPNMYIDLTATFQYYPLVKRGNLRAFMIEWADRIMFGTDCSRWGDDDETTDVFVERYYRAFKILETDGIVNGSFFGKEDVEGLNLPREVLEKIYYRNAMKVYPKVKETLKRLGYNVE